MTHTALTSTTDPAEPRARSRRLLPLAAAGVVVLLLGGAGLLLRPSHGPAPTGSTGSPPVLRLTGAGGTAAKLGAPVGEGGGRGSYVLAGALPAGRPADAPVYRFDKGAAPVDLVRRLAGALGLPGEPRRDEGGWVLSTSTRGLRVEDSRGWPWQLIGPASATRITIECLRAPCPKSSRPGNEPTDQIHGLAAPTTEQARRFASRVLRAVGLPADDLTVSQYGPVADVSAARRVNGNVVDRLATHVSMTSTGQMQNGDGWLAVAHPDWKYPLVTAAEAFRRLQAQPRPYLELCRIQPKGGCAPPEPAKVTGAKIGLMLSEDEHGALVVPAWVFTVVGDHSPVPVVAIVDRYLGEPPPARLDPGPSVGRIGGGGPAATPGAADPALRPAGRPSAH